MVDQDKMEDRSRFGKFIYTTYMFPFYDFRLTCLMQLPFNTAGKNASLSEDAIRLLYEQMYNLEHLPLENRREFHISAAHTNFIYLFIWLLDISWRTGEYFTYMTVTDKSWNWTRNHWWEATGLVGRAGTLNTSTSKTPGRFKNFTLFILLETINLSRGSLKYTLTGIFLLPRYCVAGRARFIDRCQSLELTLSIACEVLSINQMLTA